MIAGYHDELRAQALDDREELQNLIGLAAVGDGQNDIPFHDHSEIAVDCVAGMEKKRWGPGAGESSGDLATNEARFSQPGHHHLSLAAIEQIHGLNKALVEPFDQRKNPPRLYIEHIQGPFENFSSVHHPLTSF